MWIREAHIDGYGIFADFSIAPFTPGLNILCGPNEAGKSTLRDFFTCILLGFDSRTAARDFHRPLRGGEHGGRLLVVTDHGVEYVVSRHTTKKNSAPAVVLDSAGHQVDEKVLSALLRYLSKKSYTNYFAIGLDELQNFGSLQGTQLEAWLYKAGFSGRGRSVVQVLNEAESARASLYKPRGKSVISELVSELDGLQQSIGKLQDYPRRYQVLLARDREILSEITSKEALLHSKRRELARLAKIRELWPQWEQLQQLELNLPNHSERQELQRVVGLGDEITGLERGLDLYMQNLESAAQLVLELRALGERIQFIQADLGQDQALENLLAIPVGRAWELQATTLAREVEKAQTVKRARDGAVEQCQQLIQERQNQVAELDKELERLVGSDTLQDFEEKGKAVLEISRLQQELANVDLQLEANEAHCRLVNRLRGTLFPWIIGLAVGGGLMLAEFRIGITIMLIAVSGLALVAYRRQHSTSELRECLANGQALSRQRLAIEKNLTGLCRLVAGQDTLSEHELILLKQRLERQAEAYKISRQAEQAKERLAQVNRQLQQASQLAAEARDEVESASDKWCSFLREHGLPTELGLDGFMSYSASLRQLQDLERQRKQGLERQVQVERRTTAYLAGLNQVQQRLGLPLVDGARVSQAVSALTRRVSEATKKLARIDEHAMLTERLRIALGLAEDQLPAVREELASYRDHELEVQIEQLNRGVEELCADLDQLKLERGSVGLEIRQLETEEQLALLRTEQAVKTEQLERGFQDWLKWTILEFALRKAKQRYEEEKQPEVLKIASQYFATVTERRYTRVFSPIDADEIFVQTADLQKLNAANCLSRGTTEELYLCLRLALAEKVIQDGESLPLILDDVLVNMDQTRYNQVSKLITRAAGNHQIFFFTCHPQVAMDLAAKSADSMLWWLTDGKLVDSWEAGLEGASTTGLTG